jgi:iron complex transport system permease protein
MRTRRVLLFPALGAALVVAVLLNLAMGAVHISLGQAVAILAGHGGIDLGVGFTAQQDAVLWEIRLPRALMAVVVGGGLAVAGAALQGVFRNPLAEPSVIGVSSGAAVGAVACIVSGASFLGTRTVPAAAFVGALVATLAVYATARSYGRTEVVTLVLTGIAVTVIAGAITGVLTYSADDDQLRDIVFWTLGSLGGATWTTLAAVAPFIIVGSFLLPLLARPLNLMTLGDREAGHLGVAVERVRLAVIVLAALVTGAAVAVAGIVGFVGLVVPHIVRLAIGPDHRTLLPTSILGGAILVLLADLVARTVVVPEELPLGVVTALVGGPFFLWLIRRTRREHGAWA